MSNSVNTYFWKLFVAWFPILDVLVFYRRSCRTRRITMYFWHLYNIIFCYVFSGKSAIKLYHKQMLIPTPVGRSYACDELDIPLETDEDDHPPPGLRGSLLLRLLQVQPFMYRGENFEPPFECRAQTFVRDETAPIAVGSTLAIAVLMTISGYGIYRYFKVKNVQYNTME